MRRLTLLVAFLPAAAPAVAAPPSLSVVARAPLVVHGAGFAARERVTLVAAGRRLSLRASRSGAFSATLPTLDRCSAGRVIAVGASGDRAALRIPPVECAPASTP
jgi:hypothetical protein